MAYYLQVTKKGYDTLESYERAKDYLNTLLAADDYAVWECVKVGDERLAHEDYHSYYGVQIRGADNTLITIRFMNTVNHGRDVQLNWAIRLRKSIESAMVDGMNSPVAIIYYPDDREEDEAE